MDIDVWNAALATWFLSEGPRQPVYLSATAAELHRLNDGLKLGLSDPVEDLRVAVTRATYSYGTRLHWEWSRSGSKSHPPWLAFLAASVVVVEEQTEARKTEFYIAFSNFLGLAKRLTQEEYEDSFFAWWISLARWLENTHEGRRGFPTWRSIPEKGPRSVIGHPYTQVLLRREDRRDLDAFLADFSTEYGDLPELTNRLEAGLHLVGALRRWASGRHMLTSRLRSIIEGSSESNIESLAYMLLDRLFDQTSENEETSVRRLQIVPVLDEVDRELQLAAIAPQSVSLGKPLVLDECASPMLTPGQPSFLLQLPTAEILRHGTVVELPNDVTLTAPGREVHALARRDWDLWCGVRSVEAGEGVYLLAAVGLDGRLGIAATRRPIANMPSGWTIYGPVTFNADLERRAGLSLIAKDRRLVPRLRGGMALDGHRNYLVGGEPVVELPGVEGAIVLDGNVQAVEGEELSLSHLGLTAGPHAVEAGPFRFSFTSIAAEQHPLVFPTLGRTATGEVVEVSADGPDLLCGVQLRSERSQRGPLRLSPVAGEVTLFGVPGEVGVVSVTRAAWADRLGLPRNAVEMAVRSTYPGGDRVVKFPRWLAWKSSDGWTIARWHLADEPSDEPWLEPADWERAVKEVGLQPAIFQFQRTPDDVAAQSVLSEWRNYAQSGLVE